MYLILAEAIEPWVQIPTLGNIGFTLIFVLFALLHCIALEGVQRTGLFFAISALVCYAMEEIGVRTGLIYGAYHYSDLLGAKLGHVPIIIPLAWFMMIYPSWKVAGAITEGLGTFSLVALTIRAAVAAWVITGWDVVMDPGMAAAGNWVWEHGGKYFGVPLRNFLGWLVTTFLVYWIAGYFLRGETHKAGAARVFAALPLIVYAFFGLRYVISGSFPELQVVAMFSMILPAFIALILICYSRSSTIVAPAPPSLDDAA